MYLHTEWSNVIPTSQLLIKIYTVFKTDNQFNMVIDLLVMNLELYQLSNDASPKKLISVTY